MKASSASASSSSSSASSTSVYESGKPYRTQLLNRYRAGTAYTAPEAETIVASSASLRQLRKGKFDHILQHIGNDCKVVMIGEASHGTEEFYRVRAAITKELIKNHGFNFVALESDWPDSYRLNRWVQGGKTEDGTAKEALGDFVRFPTWMWRNHVMDEFATWLRSFNSKIESNKKRVGIYGLDLYSMYTSLDQVLTYLEQVDHDAAERARERYSTLGQFEDPHGYATALHMGWIESQRKEVIATLMDLQKKRLEYVTSKGLLDGDEYFMAETNAKVVRDAEEYYRKSLDADAVTWNLRDAHMFNTLRDLIRHHSHRLETEESSIRCVIWLHNTHIHDSRASEMSLRGEYNIGQLVRQHFGLNQSFSIGFSTFNGTVTASSKWGGKREKKVVLDSLPGSYEHFFNYCVTKLPPPILDKGETKSSETKEKLGEPSAASIMKEVKRSILDHSFGFVLRSNLQSRDETFEKNLKKVDDLLMPARLQRAIGVQYIPARERTAHYHYAVLPLQFDSMIHIDKTSYLQALDDIPEATDLHGEELESPPREEVLEG